MEQLIRIRDVVCIVGLSRSDIYRKMKRGLFPKPVPVVGGV
jgi:predicted DNA-binding transcriptional regulator AlpA